MNLYMIEAMELEHDILSTSDMCNIYLMEKKVESVKQSNNTIDTKAEPVEKSKLRKVIDKIIQSIKNFIEKIKKFFTGDTKKMMEQVKNDHSKGDPECERSIKELRKLIKKGQFSELTHDEWERYNEYEEKLIKRKKVAKATGGVLVSGVALYGLYMDLWGAKKSCEKDVKELKRAKKLASEGKKDEIDRMIKDYEKRNKPLMIKINKLLASIFNPRSIAQFLGIAFVAKTSEKIGNAVVKKTGQNIGTKRGLATYMGTAMGVYVPTAVGFIKGEKAFNKKMKEKYPGNERSEKYKNAYSYYRYKGQDQVDEHVDKLKKLRDSIDKA